MRITAASVAAVFLAGCGADGNGGDEVGAPAVRDSAGAAIVEHPVLDTTSLPRWRLAREPSLDIGRRVAEQGVDEPYLLHQLRDVVRLPDGSIAVIAGNEVRSFGPDGVHRWSQGFPGEGPGAYRTAADLSSFRGDSLVVWDYELRRFTILGPTGGLGRVVAVETPATPRMAHTDALDRLTVEAIDWETRPWRDGLRIHRMYSVLIRFAPDGTRIDSPARALTYITYRREDGYALEPPWTTRRWVAATGDGFWHANPYVPELRYRTRADGLERIVRWNAPRFVVTEDDLAQYDRWTTAELASADERNRRAILDMMDRVPEPERMPAFDVVMTDRSGRLWLRDYVREDREERVPPNEPRGWTVLASDGRTFVARFVQPAAFEIYDLGEEWILGVETDALDVPHVRLYRLETMES